MTPLTREQRIKIAELRNALDNLAKPLGDLNLLREAFDELLMILLEQPEEPEDETEETTP